MRRNQTPRMYEQADKTGDNFRYSWILDAPYALRNKLQGWRWIKGAGCPGCFVTNDQNLAAITAQSLNLTIVSNDTQNVLNAPGCLTQKPQRQPQQLHPQPQTT